MFGVLALIGAAVGAVSGVVGQVISDVITSCLTGEATVSSMQTYAGALIGGVASGVTFALTGNAHLAGAVGGGVTTFSASALEKLTNSEYDQSWGEILINTAVDTGVGAALSFVDVPLDRVTSGRNSHMAVYKGGLTRIRNGNARRMSVGVMKKGLFAFSVSSFPMVVYYGVKQYAYPLLMDASEEIQYPIGPAYFEAH